MATETFKLISDLPAGPTNLVGTELVEIQNGAGAGASQQTTAAKMAAIALRQSVQAVTSTTPGVTIDDTNPNAPVITIPVMIAGTGGVTIDETNPAAPKINIPSDGGVSAAYGQPGGTVLQVGAAIAGIATSGYNLTGWEIQCSPSGSITVDLQIGTLGSAPASIIGTGNGPSIASGTTGSSSVLTGWTSLNIPRGSVVNVVVKTVSLVEWFNVAFLGNRT
jgi:hypothetical protein